jgi:hypothetical protein
MSVVLEPTTTGVAIQPMGTMALVEPTGTMAVVELVRVVTDYTFLSAAQVAAEHHLLDAAE